MLDRASILQEDIEASEERADRLEQKEKERVERLNDRIRLSAITAAQMKSRIDGLRSRIERKKRAVKDLHRHVENTRALSRQVEDV